LKSFVAGSNRFNKQGRNNDYSRSTENRCFVPEQPFAKDRKQGMVGQQDNMFFTLFILFAPKLLEVYVL